MVGWDSVTPSERAVVDLVCEGLTNPQIAERLTLSPRTVQRHLYKVFRKVGVTSRTQLVAMAMRRELTAVNGEGGESPPES